MRSTLSSSRLSQNRVGAVKARESRGAYKPSRLGLLGEDFDQKVISSRWTTQGTPAVGLALAEDSWASVSFNNTNQYCYVPAPSGDFTATLAMEILSPGSNMQGLVIVDNSGNGVGMIPYNSGDNILLVSITAGVYGGTFNGTNMPAGTPSMFTGLLTHYRIVKSGTSYVGYVSSYTDGSGTFLGPTGSITGPATATRVGVGRLFGTNTVMSRIDWLDIV